MTWILIVFTWFFFTWFIAPNQWTSNMCVWYAISSCANLYAWRNLFDGWVMWNDFHMHNWIDPSEMTYLINRPKYNSIKIWEVEQVTAEELDEILKTTPVIAQVVWGKRDNKWFTTGWILNHQICINGKVLDRFSYVNSRWTWFWSNGYWLLSGDVIPQLNIQRISVSWYSWSMVSDYRYRLAVHLKNKPKALVKIPRDK